MAICVRDPIGTGGSSDDSLCGFEMKRMGPPAIPNAEPLHIFAEIALVVVRRVVAKPVVRAGAEGSGLVVRVDQPAKFE